MTETLIRITYTNLHLSCLNDCLGKYGLWERIWDFEGFKYFEELYIRFSKQRVGIWEILGLEYRLGRGEECFDNLIGFSHMVSSGNLICSAGLRKWRTGFWLETSAFVRDMSGHHLT